MYSQIGPNYLGPNLKFFWNL